MFSTQGKSNILIIISLLYSCDKLTLSDSNLSNMEPVDMANADLIYFALCFANVIADNVILALRVVDMMSSRCP